MQLKFLGVLNAERTCIYDVRFWCRSVVMSFFIPACRYKYQDFILG
jgi:hypothetical protein